MRQKPAPFNAFKEEVSAPKVLSKEEESQEVLKLYDGFHNNIQKMILLARDRNDAIVTKGLETYFKDGKVARVPWGQQNIITLTQACYIVFSRTEDALTYRLYALNQATAVEPFHSGKIDHVVAFAEIIKKHTADQEAPF